MRTRNACHLRRSAVLAMVAICTVVILGMAALAIDLSRLTYARAQLQSSADAAALAGAGAMLTDQRLKGPVECNYIMAQAREAAVDYAARNHVMGQAPVVLPNAANAPDGDIVIGYLPSLTAHSGPLDLSDPMQYNTVRVRVVRNEQQNGPIPLTFAAIFGRHWASVGASAAASFEDGVVGFQVLPGAGPVQLLPFAIEEQAWLKLMNAAPTSTNDRYGYNPDTMRVSSGGDEVAELNVYPGGGTSQLPAGNFGTVNIGPSYNPTDTLCRQIREGVSAEDLAYFGGVLQLGRDGTLLLNGDTGVSAGIETSLESIIGQPRIMPVFRTAVYNGNRATYTIVAFAGIRLMGANLQGSMRTKQLFIQPCVVSADGAITDPDAAKYNVYRAPMLTR